MTNPLYNMAQLAFSAQVQLTNKLVQKLHWCRVQVSAYCFIMSWKWPLMLLVVMHHLLYLPFRQVKVQEVVCRALWKKVFIWSCWNSVAFQNLSFQSLVTGLCILIGSTQTLSGLSIYFILFLFICLFLMSNVGRRGKKLSQALDLTKLDYIVCHALTQRTHCTSSLLVLEPPSHSP